MKAMKAKGKKKKKNTDKAHLIQFQLFIFCKRAFLQKNFHGRHAIHTGIFLERALWADNVSPWMNTIAPGDQFKPTRIGIVIPSPEIRDI